MDQTIIPLVNYWVYTDIEFWLPPKEDQTIIPLVTYRPTFVTEVPLLNMLLC